MPITFEHPEILSILDQVAPEGLDSVPFGVVQMDLDGIVLAYNKFESQLSGLSPERVLGKNFFRDVAPCTNNYLVASKFEDAVDLDHRLDYVFTVRMRPTSVKLRLLKSTSSPHQYLLVQPVG